MSLNRLQPTVGLQRRQVCYVDVASESIELKIDVGCSVARCVKHERRNFVTKTTFATVGVLQRPRQVVNGAIEQGVNDAVEGGAIGSKPFCDDDKNLVPS